MKDISPFEAMLALAFGLLVGFFLILAVLTHLRGL
jgi:hypothetical protein